MERLIPLLYTHTPTPTHSCMHSPVCTHALSVNLTLTDSIYVLPRLVLHLIKAVGTQRGTGPADTSYITSSILHSQKSFILDCVYPLTLTLTLMILLHHLLYLVSFFLSSCPGSCLLQNYFRVSELYLVPSHNLFKLHILSLPNDVYIVLNCFPNYVTW